MKKVLFFWALCFFFMVSCSKETSSFEIDTDTNLREIFYGFISSSTEFRTMFNNIESIDFESLVTHGDGISERVFKTLKKQSFIKKSVSYKNMNDVFHIMNAQLKFIYEKDPNGGKFENYVSGIKRGFIDIRSCKAQWDSCTQLAGVQYAAGIVACGASATIPIAGPVIAGACLVVVGTEFYQDWDACDTSYRICVRNK